MTDAQTILRLIEAVDREDSEKLDEIDVRVWFFVREEDPIKGQTWKGPKPPEFSRSRDALKAIRPEGWCLERVQTDDRLGYSFILTKMNAIGWGAHIKTPDFKWFKTEELAELHAIIQAIEYER